MTKRAALLLKIIGVCLCILPPFIATLSYFPLWQIRGVGAELSGVAVLLLIPILIPLLKLLREKIKSPSAPLVWIILFIVFSALSSICEQMKVISFFGALGNLAGAVLFNLAKKRSEDDEELR